MITRAIRTTALPALVVLGAACATAPRVDRASEEQRIRELTRQALRAAQAKDAAALAAVYSEDAVLMGENAPIAVGREAIRNAFAQMLALPNVAVTFEPTRIEVAESGDLAYALATHSVASDMPGGRLDNRGKHVAVFRKIGGEWKVAAFAGTSDLPIQQIASAMTPRQQISAGAVAPAEGAAAAGGHFHARELVWRDAPPSLPRGARIAVLEGDPSQPGPFTFRLQLPANYRVPPHFHPVIEHVTVISGTFSVGKGERWDDSQLQRLEAGGFIYMPAGTRHFAQATGETVIQLHSMGPWGVTYVDPKDDPRNRTP